MGTEDKLGVQPEVGNVRSIWQDITYVIYFSPLAYCLIV